MGGQDPQAVLRPRQPPWQWVYLRGVSRDGIKEVLCALDGIGEAIDELHVGSRPFPPRVAMPQEPEQTGALERL